MSLSDGQDYEERNPKAPPIHSDSAGENDTEAIKAANAIGIIGGLPLMHFIEGYNAKSPTPQTGREEYERGLNDGHVAAMEQMKEHQQQTGRTYTEGELLDFAIKYSYQDLPVKRFLIEYLKQNPKP